jgi:hypothetical protein
MSAATPTSALLPPGFVVPAVTGIASAQAPGVENVPGRT